MTGLILTGIPLALQTRRKRQIDNYLDRGACVIGIHQMMADYKNKHPNAVHRPVGPSKTYNCHGLVFAARRTAITDSSAIQQSIDEDDYIVVDRRDVMPGDIVIYNNNGDIEHSGIVVEKRATDLSPMILSKWGQCHEVIHSERDCPYLGSTIYYRIAQ